MDSIRLRQIREALDTDKRMYAAAFELEKRRVARMDEKPDDQTAAQQGSLETVGEALSELKENLEERVIALHSFSSDYKTSDDSVNTLAAIEATIRYYNRVAGAFSTPATPQQARQQIMTAAAELESPLNELTTGLTKMLNHIAGSSATLQKRLFVKVARGLNAYDLLLKRVRSRNLMPISQTDLNANYDSLIKNHPTWGTIARNNSLGRPTYPDDDDDDGGGTPGGTTRGTTRRSTRSTRRSARSPRDGRPSGAW